MSRVGDFFIEQVQGIVDELGVQERNEDAIMEWIMTQSFTFRELKDHKYMAKRYKAQVTKCGMYFLPE